MPRNIVVTDANHRWIETLPVEIVERKGDGHPDTLCDGMAERIARDYAQWCDTHLGVQLHHNFDKLQLVAGRVEVDFGRGTLLEPMRVQIAGRASEATGDGRPVPLQVIAIQAAKNHLRETMRYLDPDKHAVVECYAGSGSGQLVQVVENATANDTSFGAAHWPLSELEQIVLDTAHYLNGSLRDQLPIGEDIKVMGTRLGETIDLTCAAPAISTKVANLQRYREVKAALQEQIAAHVANHTLRTVNVGVNMADDEDGGNVYLTLTGSSAENGDDGSVGRGNRVTGLITPFRPQSLEATAGKNAHSHAGKIYNVLALLMAQTVVREVANVRQVEVVVLSEINRPLQDPLVATAAVTTVQGALTAATKADVQAVMEAQLAEVQEVSRKIRRGEFRLF